jgi:hypothetical protein
MRDLISPNWMWLKVILFLVIGCASSFALLALAPDWHVFVLLLLTVWAFCRAYYFAFYVLEHYIDPSFRYSGLGSLLNHLRRRRQR